MATTISTQDLVDAKRDIDDIGKAVNQKEVVHPRYGDSFKSLPMIVDEFQISSDAAEEAAVSAAESANIAQSSSQIAQDSAASAEFSATNAAILSKVYPDPEAGVDPVTGVSDGAYFNVRSSSDESYVDEYQNVGGVATPTGKSYPSSNLVSDLQDAIKPTEGLFRVNAKALGIVPFTDITAQLEYYLNDSVTHEIYLPKSEYILSRKITINSIHPKKIVLEQGAYFKPDTADGVVLFDIYSHLEFENLSFDFDGKGCFTAVRYNQNCGIVRLKKTTFKNLKDVDATRATTLLSVSAVGNFLDIDGVYFDNCLKRGNGSITDSAGSLNGLYISGTATLLGGRIDNVDVSNFHNINASDQIIIEDTAGLYVATNGLPIPLTIGKVTGTEFGKRLVKLQCSGTTFSYIDGLSESGDSWSVVGVLSEPGVFYGSGNTFNYVKARGNMDYAFADQCENTKVETLDIKVYGSNTLNTGAIGAGLFLSEGSSGLIINNLISEARRPVSFFPNSIDAPIKATYIKNANLTVTGAGTESINIAGNATTAVGAIDGLTIDNLTVSNNGSSNTSVITTLLANLNYRDFRFGVINIMAQLLDFRISLGTLSYINGVNIGVINYVDVVGQLPTIADFVSIRNCRNVNIDKLTLPIVSNRTFYILDSSAVVIGESMDIASATTAQVVTSNSTDIVVLSRSLSIVESGTSGEILRFSGTTSQRPKRAKQGFTYFDTTANQLTYCSASGVIAQDGTLTTEAVYNLIPRLLQATAVFDPPSIPADGSTTTNVTLTGAAPGSAVLVGFSNFNANIDVSAKVIAWHTVQVTFKNTGSSSVDLASGTITVKAI